MMTPSIEISKPKHFTPKKIVLHIADQIANLIDGSCAQAALSTVKFFTEFEKDELRAPKEIAWVWFHQLATDSLYRFITKGISLDQLNQKERIGLIANFIATNPIPVDSRIEPMHLIAPITHSYFKELIPNLPALYNSADPADTPLSPEKARHKFNTAIRDASLLMNMHQGLFYAPLFQSFNHNAGELFEREYAWLRHERYIIQSYETTPIFSIDESDKIPLKSVFISPRCSWQNNTKEKEIVPRNYAMLDDTLNHWLNENNYQEDPIRVITGGPGCGKSSFSSYFASQLVARGSHRVIHIGLQHFDHESDLKSAFDEYFDAKNNEIDESGNKGFFENPIDWRSRDETPLLIICDGLDELSVKEEESKEIATDFILKLERMIRRLNSANKHVKAIILGRNAACESAMEIAHLPRSTMLEIAPLSPERVPPSPSLMAMMDAQRYASDAEMQLMRHDQRPGFWEKWHQAQGSETPTFPEEFNSEDIQELTSEPLLFLLLLLFEKEGHSWNDAIANKNVIYKSIMEKLVGRDKDKKIRAADNEELLLKTLGVLGFSACMNNGRTATQADLDDHIKLLLKSKEQASIQNEGLDNIKNLAIRAHTRGQKQDTSSGYEFIHKSFGEYFAATAIRNYLQSLLLQKEEIDGIEKTWDHFLAISQDFSRSSNFEVFLQNEILNEIEIEEAKAIQAVLIQFLQTVADQSFTPPEAKSHKLLKRRIYNSVSFLHLLVSQFQMKLMANALDTKRITIETAFHSELADIRKVLFGFEYTNTSPGYETISKIHMEQSHISELKCDIMTLTRSSFLKCELNNIRFTDTQLNLFDFDHCSLADCHYNSASMLNGGFEGTKFSSTDFINCTVAYIRFIDCKFNDCRFEGGTLSNTYFHACDFESTRFDDVIFRNCDLSRIKCLTQDSLERCYGDAQTKIPDYLERPKHWAALEVESEFEE